MNESSVRNILDFPDEILVKIILYSNAGERLALGKSCQRFNDLVFGEKDLLRNLDFSGGCPHTKESDIQQYFSNENMYKRIFRINVENVEAVVNLSSSIGKAINLVELNILNAIRFKSAEELSSFLKPLVHLKRLSVNWPGPSTERDYSYSKWNQVLGEPFSRLTYLSLKLHFYTAKFLLVLQLCQQLEELHIEISRTASDDGPLPQESMKLSKLKLLKLIVCRSHSGRLRNHFMSIISDPAEWTDFYLDNDWKKVHLERNVEVCAALERVKQMPLPEALADCRESGLIDKSWPLVSENLLSEVIRVTHEDAPEKFCCLSRYQDSCRQGCPLTTEKAKELLKDPGNQISHLEFSHVTEKNCDVHLVASAFPNLTELVLSQISNWNSTSTPEQTQPLYRRLRKKGSLAFEEYSDARSMDTSFKMLVENTPHLRALTIGPTWGEIGDHWDLDAFYLISGWKNLTALRVYNIPIRGGKFLIDIGRECKKLEEVKLCNLGPNSECNWESDLLQMLQHCRNLRRLSVRQMSLKLMSKMFSLLSNSSKLEDLLFFTRTEKYDSVELTASVEKMIRECRELNKFSINIRPCQNCGKLKLAVERIISELNRPDFQFKIC